MRRRYIALLRTAVGCRLFFRTLLAATFIQNHGMAVAGSVVAVEDGLTVLQVRGESRSASGHGDQETQGCTDSERAPGG